MEFTFQLISQPDIPNVNGVVYSKESFDKMFNSEWTKKILDNKGLRVVTGYYMQGLNDNPVFDSIDPVNCIGEVEDWTGSSVKVDINNPVYTEIVKELQDNLKLGMNYTCRLNKNKDGYREAVGMRIHSFSLIDKRTHKYI